MASALETAVNLAIMDHHYRNRTNKEQTKKLKEVSATIAQVKRHALWLRRVDQSLKPLRISVKPTAIAENLLQRPEGQDDIISRLPAEIKVMVWSHLKTHPDRVALALTCKWNAQVFEQVKERQHINKLVRVTKPQKLMMMIRLIDWMKPEDRLCFHCYRYSERSESGWGGDTQFEDMARDLDKKAEGHENIIPTQKGTTIPREATLRGPRCPTCVKRENYAVTAIAHSQEVKELKAMIKKKKIDHI